MSDSDPAEMGADEREAFLGTGGTGVIAFGTTGEEAPHAIPVSYGYDPVEGIFYFRLAADADSEKHAVADRAVSLVVYGQDEAKWRSVVAKGVLEETTEESIATDTLQGLERVHIPLLDVFGTPPGEVPFEFYRLVPDTLTSRKEATSEL
jgi:hypothetical protein